MTTIERVTTPDKFEWRCGVKFCRFIARSTDHDETEAQRERHRSMHALAKEGTRVRIVNGHDLWPARVGDTGKITHAYIDQDRYGVLLDRKGKCGGCRHCDGCGGPTRLSTQVHFDNLERVRG